MDRQRRYYSNRVRIARRERLDTKRKEFLNLANAEPNLGYPVSLGDPISQPFPELDHVLVAREDGTKKWSQSPEGLKIDGQNSMLLNKRSFDQGYVPTIEDLEFGQILINVYDSKLFIKQLVDGVQTISEIETGIQGPQGVQGTQGLQGERQPFIPVQVVGNVPDVNASYPGPGGPDDPQGLLNYYFPAPSLGGAVFDLATSDLWVWVGGVWLNAGLLRGPEGMQGIQGLQGIQGNTGIQGPFGIQGPRGFAGLQGIQGIQGLQGIQGRVGRSLRLLGSVETTGDIPGYPNSAEPGVEVGDAYVVLSDGNIYIWSGETWVNGGRILIQGIQGTQGPQGVQGPQGLQGYPLEVIDTYTDPLIPLDSAFLEDSYPDANPYSGVVDTTSGNGVLWQKKEDGEWEQIGVVSIQGPQGPQGLQGPQSAQGTQGVQGPQGLQGRYGPATEVIAIYNNPSELLTSELLNDLHPDAEWLNVVVDITSGNGVMWQKTLIGTWEEIGIISVQGTQGLQGTAGTDGLQGLQGLDGAFAAQGIQGPSGSQGIAGSQGATGGPGAQGTQGIQGAQGTQGGFGPQGLTGEFGGQGVQGIQGPQGATGSQGVSGATGSSGLQGIQGPQGPQGTTGSQGASGVVGSSGIQGIQGPQGPQGAVGSQGVSGVVGSSGAQGTQGIQGIQGLVGIQGLDGAFAAQGIQGPAGAQGIRGISGTAGTTGLQGPQGIQGVQGTRGVQGVQGVSGTVGSIGSQGAQGIQGIQGLLGVQGSLGVQGLIGPQGIQGISGATGGVTSFSAGTTGFLPSSSTTGAITLSGTLSVANGGTGVTTSTGTGSTVRNLLPTINSPTFTGNPTAPTPDVSDNDTSLATTAYVVSRISQDAPTKTGGGASGTWGINITGSAQTVNSLDQAQVRNAYANSPFGTTGTYAFMITNFTIGPNTTYCAPGETKAGSELRYAGLFRNPDDGSLGLSTDSAVPAGTWRCMGFARNSANVGSRSPATLWLRIA